MKFDTDVVHKNDLLMFKTLKLKKKMKPSAEEIMGSLTWKDLKVQRCMGFSQELYEERRKTKKIFCSEHTSNILKNKKTMHQVAYGPFTTSFKHLTSKSLKIFQVLRIY